MIRRVWVVLNASGSFDCAACKVRKLLGSGGRMLGSSEKNKQLQKLQQIPPLRCGMTNRRTGNSKSKRRGFFAALRMTA